MTLRVLSFGFKYGTPADADVVFDVRFLKNPYFVPELKRLPGTDKAVRDFVLALPETDEFLKRTLDLLRYVVPKYEQEGKSYLTIAFGCTGGMHRSVVVAEHVAAALDTTLNQPDSPPAASEVSSNTAAGQEDAGTPHARIEIAVVHRDVARSEPSTASVPPRSLP
jgi:UPF0042 nucleotide-binding protein